MLVIALSSLGFWDRMSSVLWDNFLALQQREIASDIVVIEIDAKSIDALETWPWSRNIYANASDKIAKANSNSVFIDIDFSSRSNDTEADANLARSLGELSKTTTLRLPIFLQQESSRNKNLVIRQALLEADEFVSVNLRPGKDGLVRSLESGISWQGEYFDSAWNAIAEQKNNSTWIDYSIDIDSFDYISFFELLSDNFEISRLEGKDIFIGATAIELGDNIAVPIYQSIPGIILHGLATETLRQGGLYKLATPVSIVLLLLLGMFAAFQFKRQKWLAGLLSGAATLLLFIPIHYFFYFQFNLMLPAFPIIAMLSAVYFASIILKLDSTLFQKFWLQVTVSHQQLFINSIYAISNECILTIDPNGTILSANKKSQDIFSREKDELASHNIRDFIPIADFKMWLDHSEPFDTNIITSNAESVAVEICISPIESASDFTYTIAIRDMSERYEREASLAFALDYDDLTKVFNRDKFFNLSDQIIASNEVCYLLKIDVAYFNEINSIYGHEIGDLILQTISGRLLEPLSGQNTIGRVGKNEFAILLSNIHKEEASGLTKRLVAILNRPLIINERSIEIFCHIGITSNRNKKTSIEQLVSQANKALILARTRGLESEWLEQEQEVTEPHKLEVIGKIRQSLRKSDFNIAFQPKIRLSDSTFIGCELLLRPPKYWDTSISVANLIENAEKTNLISPLTLFTVDKVLALEKDWMKSKLPRNISINMSIGLMSNDQFFDDLLTRIDDSIGYFKFTFEITETSLSTDWGHSLRNIKRLTQREISISIDDFGTGYSSLKYLRDLKASELKIDMSFITNIQDDKNNQAIVKSTIKMAHELGLTVVAEGIESRSEQEFLLSCGCDLGQGYYFAKPMAFTDLPTWVQVNTTSNVVQWPFNNNKK